MMYGQEMEDNAERGLKAIFLVVTLHMHMHHFQDVNRNSCPGGANLGFSIGIVSQRESCV